MTRGTRTRWRLVRRHRTLLVVPALLGLLLLVPGGLHAQTPEDVDVETITDNLDDYIGREVILTTSVTEVLEPRAFVVGDEGVIGIGGAQLLVLSQNTPSIAVAEGHEVRVTGRVGRFDLEAFERAVGGQLDDTPYADWDDEAVLVLMAIEAR